MRHKNNLNPPIVETGSIRDGFGKGLVEAGKRYNNIVGLSADLSESVRMNWFKELYPLRYVEVGVAEQNLIGVAAGLALGGKHPFATSYAAFSPGNSWGVIRTCVCYSDLAVTIVGGHAGLSVGEDGATHQALEDIALMRVLPNMTVIVPADEFQSYQATLALAKLPHPSYLRLSRISTPQITSEFNYTGNFQIGKAQVLRPGNDVCIIACGIMVAKALEAALNLEKLGIDSRVVNLHTIKPIDTEIILQAMTETKAIITVEEHQVSGGMGSAVSEVINQAYLFKNFRKPVPLKIMGVEDKFGESGTTDLLLAKYGLTSQDIINTVKNII